MNFLETIQLSITAILANRLRSSLTILGIVIGVMSVIILVSLVSGLQKYITDQISGLGSNIMFVIPGTPGGGRGPGGIVTNRLTSDEVTALQNGLGDSAQVAGAINSVSTLQFGNKKSDNATILGTEANVTNIIKVLKITEGRFMTTSEGKSANRVAVLGPTAAENLFGGNSAIGKVITIGKLKYTVIGILEARGSTFGMDQDNTAVIPINAAQRQFGVENVNSIYISANNPEEVNRVQEKSQQILLKKLDKDDFTIQTQEQTLDTISQITGVLTAALGGIAAISLLVGGIGVMNIMLVSVTERTREIGLRKALGAKPKDIRNQFLIEALTLSGLGGIIGILLGYGISMIINIFFTTTVPLWSVLLSFGFSMLVGIIFGVAPAIRAAKLNPIQALRYE